MKNLHDIKAEEGLISILMLYPKNITETIGSSTSSFNNLTMPSTSIGSSTNGNYASFEGDLQGTGFTTNIYNAIHGVFFGSSAESIGGTWDIQNNGATGSGAGYFAAKKN